MDDSLSIPDEAIRYILFQRGEYLRTPVTPLYRHMLRHLPFSLPIYNAAVAVESRGRGRSVKALYDADMRREYASIARFLPERCSAILDIGCGVAGIDAFLYRRYADQSPDIYLLDKSRVERAVYYLFAQRAAFYNSLEVARALLVANGVPSRRVHPLEATSRNDIELETKVDLVLSLISWGFHYPVDTYVDRVRSLLSEDGVVILDVRKGTAGLDILQRRFSRVDPIFERRKWHRVAVRA
ncbi:MAG: hypothetical protein M3O34_20700 [Chloroflexota bacterium]|nr:hypothetical protein [Chloroflexota bacterium]